MSLNFIESLCKNIATEMDYEYGNEQDDIEEENQESLEVNKIELLTNFFNNIKTDKIIETFREMCGIEGFTLAYGNFMKKDILDINYDTEQDDHERMKNDLKKFKKDILKKYLKNCNIYRLPCCWPKETNFNSFIGINIYPFIWSNNRFFWQEKLKNDNIHLVLKSANDRWIMKKEYKEKLLQELSHYNRYELPFYIKKYVKIMRQKFFSTDGCLEKSIYLSNYSFNDEWNEVLNKTFENLIDTYSDIIENETGLKGTWCLLPNDCFFCT